MTATGANTPLTFISEVTFNPLAIIGSTHIEGTFYLFTVPTANTILKIGQIWSLTYSPVSTNDSAFTTKLKLLYNNYLYIILIKIINKLYYNINFKNKLHDV